MKKLFLAVIILTTLTTMAMAKAKVFSQQTIECVKTNATIQIDGQMDEAWEASNVYSMYVVSTTNKPLSPAEVRTMYDNQNLYIFMKTKDKDVKASETKPDGSTCQDDVLEFFLRPGVNCPWYYNAEINALGTAYTAKNHVGGGGNDTHWSKMWDPTFDYAIYIKGTINNCDDIDGYWTLEVKLPFSTIDVLKGMAPKAGDKWMCNFAKYDYSIYLPADINGIELCSVCHTDAVWFHELVNYCPLIFK
ncbi:MAG: carbohydrate-binding family 9-like protein [Abditibacteriota bacterium]|nr:carbohydrate-binding family 9-like protein [Abditibacteriota bacterium]